MSAETLRRSALTGQSDVGRRVGNAPTQESPAPTLAEVYEANFRYVWRCLRSLGVVDDALDDAVQDVFLVVQRKLERFDGRADLRTWLYAIGLRVARRYRARAAREAARFSKQTEPGAGRRRASPPPDGLPSPTLEGDLEREIEHEERLALARRALETLDDDKREAFVLSQIEQMSAPEMARILGLPVNTIYSRIRAARLAFGAALERLGTAQGRSSR